MNKVNTIFIGTGEFAIPILQKLLSLESIKLDAVVTQPDKPAGRKQELTAGPIKNYLNKNNTLGIDIIQPEKIRLVSQEILDKYKPELIIVAAYGQIIPKDILEYPKYKCLNIHGSLLPELRGAVPVPMAILQNLKETGVTIQRMVFEMDEGPIIASAKYQIQDDETTESLMKALSEIGADLLQETLDSWIDGRLSEVPQDSTRATYCYKDDISKSKAKITFSTEIDLAERMVRAFFPWPIAWLKMSDGKMLKIFKSKKVLHQENPIVLQNQEAIKVIKDGKRLILSLDNGALELLEVQLEGKKRDSAKNYLYLAE